MLTSPAYPAHPNALGMEYAAREVLGVLGRPIPNDFKILRRRGGRRGAIALRLQAPSRGSFRVSGGVRTLRRRAVGAVRLSYRTRTFFAPRAGALSVRLRPRRALRGALGRLGRLQVALTITFAPIAGQPATRRTAIRVGTR